MDESTIHVTTDVCPPHDFSVEVEVPAEDLPSYVTGPVNDRYCSLCGSKETFKDRMEMLSKSEVLPPPEPTQVPQRRSPVVHLDPNPRPLHEIHVELNLKHYGKRYDNNRRRGIVDRAINIEGDMRLNDALAAAAEEYASQALGLYYEGDVRGPDRGYDLLMRGRRIQVKWSRSHSNRLIASPKQKNLADYYMLVTGADPAEFQMAGWATLAELKSQMKDLGYGPTYCLDQYQLHPFEDLLDLRNSLLDSVTTA